MYVRVVTVIGAQYFAPPLVIEIAALRGKDKETDTFNDPFFWCRYVIQMPLIIIRCTRVVNKL